MLNPTCKYELVWREIDESSRELWSFSQAIFWRQIPLVSKPMLDCDVVTGKVHLKPVRTISTQTLSRILNREQIPILEEVPPHTRCFLNEQVEVRNGKISNGTRLCISTVPHLHEKLFPLHLAP